MRTHCTIHSRKASFHVLQKMCTIVSHAPWPDKTSLHRNPCVCYLKASAFVHLRSQFCVTSWLKDTGLRGKNLVTIKFIRNWIQKMKWVHTMKYLALKKKEILLFVTIQMNLKDIMPVNKPDTQNKILHELTYM